MPGAGAGRLALGPSQSGEPKKDAPTGPEYTAATAEAAVKAGDAPVALIIPAGFGQHPIAFGPDAGGSTLELLNDQSDTIAPQIVVGLLQKAAMTSMPSAMADEGMKYADEYVGGFTPAQKAKVDGELEALRKLEADGKAGTGSGSSGAEDSETSAGIVQVNVRAVVGENKKSPMISFYAAAIGVMFLMFTASGSAGALLDEAESGTLERVLSTRVTMTKLLAGKLVFNTGLAFVQLVAMFLWGWAAFKLDFFQPSARVRGDGIVDGVCSGGVRNAAGEPVPHAGATGRAVDAGDSDYVVDGREHVSAVPDAGGDAEGGTADDQRVGDRWIHKGVLAGFAGDGAVAAGVGAFGSRSGAVRGCAEDCAAVGVRVRSSG